VQVDLDEIITPQLVRARWNAEVVVVELSRPEMERFAILIIGPAVGRYRQHLQPHHSAKVVELGKEVPVNLVSEGTRHLGAQDDQIKALKMVVPARLAVNSVSENANPQRLNSTQRGAQECALMLLSNRAHRLPKQAYLHRPPNRLLQQRARN
jgi:hypothetical protein